MMPEISSWIVLAIFALFNTLVIAVAFALKHKDKAAASKKPKPRPLHKEMTYRLKNNLLELDRIIDMVNELERYQVPVKTVFDINLVLEEAFTNILVNAYDDRKEHIITITLKLAGKRLAMEVADDGRPFNPLDAPAFTVDMPLEDISLEGLGIHLIRHLVDEIEYRRADGKNILTLQKAITEDGGEPEGKDPKGVHHETGKNNT